MASAVCFRFELSKGVITSMLLTGMVLFGSSHAERTDCIQLSADKFGLPASLIQAILQVEGGSVGQAVSNNNGTEDMGPMQINTIWLPELAANGITRQQLQHDRCINILAGSWILARQMKTAKNMEGPLQRRIMWGIGAYHSRTPEYNVKYALKVWQVLNKDLAEPVSK